MDPTVMHFIYEYPYRKQLDVEICYLGEDDKLGQYLVLNQTNFHAHGGGQKGDRGELVFLELPYTGAPATVPISDTRGEKQGIIKHVIGRGVFDPSSARDGLPGARAVLTLDWSFREMQMRLHSVAHLQHSFLELELQRALPYPSTSDIREMDALNVYDEDLKLEAAAAARVDARLNEFISAGHPITTHPDPMAPGRRLWRCGDFVVPCGGTHPHNSTELGRVSSSVSVKKGKTKIVLRVS